MVDPLDMDKIARVLGAERREKVRATGGYFGATRIAAEIEDRLKTPPGGGRPTDPTWTEKRLVRLSPESLERLKELAEQIGAKKGLHLNAMQIAAYLLEKALQDADEDLDADLLHRKQA